MASRRRLFLSQLPAARRARGFLAACAWLSSSLFSQPVAAEGAGCGPICLLDGLNQPIDPERGALEVSRFVTNGGTLSRSDEYQAPSLASSDVRIQVEAAAGEDAVAVLESRTPNGTLRSSLRLPLTHPTRDQPWRSPFVRLVGDDIDLRARGAENRVLLVALRDRVVLRYQSAGRALEQTLRVARPGHEDDPAAARQARLHVHILRLAARGRSVIGRSDAEALQLMRAQLQTANEIWLQCDLTFGPPSEVAMEILDPPPPTLFAIANEDGLPARGGGEIRFRIGNQSFGPIATHPGAAPVATARDIERALKARGFFAEVSQNLPTRSGAGPSADVLVRRSDGGFVTIEPEPELPITSDRRQSVLVGRVDLQDGLREFDNMTAQVGSLEERTLLKALSDDDPRSIDLFVINQFSGATRQGEAFISEPSAAIVNTVVIDRNGLRHLPLAWTLAHELGHVLMNDPLHPDNIGPDRPWLLMDADNGRGTVDGPKRLRTEDCERVRQAASGGSTPLLLPFDNDAPRG